MNNLNEILHELGISKVKLAKYLGVSRQMIYNYLELDDLNKWPKDKKVLLFNLLGIKNADDLKKVKVDTDYIMSVETRINNIYESNTSNYSDSTTIYEGLGKKQKELLHNIVELLKEKLDDEKDETAYYTYLYLYHFIQSLDSSKELKYMLGYVAKASGFVKPMEFVFNEEQQFTFESIMFSGMSLYNSGAASKTRIAESHKRFVDQIEQKREEKLSRTLELNTIKIQALKELGYTEITNQNAAEVFEKIAEIESRGV